MDSEKLAVRLWLVLVLVLVNIGGSSETYGQALVAAQPQETARAHARALVHRSDT